MPIDIQVLDVPTGKDSKAPQLLHLPGFQGIQVIP